MQRPFTDTLSTVSTNKLGRIGDRTFHEFGCDSLTLSQKLPEYIKRFFEIFVIFIPILAPAKICRFQWRTMNRKFPEKKEI